MRITDAGRFDLMRRELARTNEGMAKQNERLATGRAINRLSDDPELAVQADRLLVEDRALVAYSEAADNARAWLSTQDGALQAASNVMHRVRELAIAAGSPLGSEAREGIASELEGLRSQLVDIANTQFQGRAVFAGFGQAAVNDAAGSVSFVGDSGEVQRRIASDRVVKVNVSGAAAFGFDAGEDVFGVIAGIAANVRANDIASVSTTGLTAVEAASKRVLESLGSVGARANLVDNAVTGATTRRDEIQRYRSSIVDADLAETALALTLAETAYEAVLAATSRLQRPTLVDYLR